MVIKRRGQQKLIGSFGGGKADRVWLSGEMQSNTSPGGALEGGVALGGRKGQGALDRIAISSHLLSPRLSLIPSSWPVTHADTFALNSE